MTVNKAKCYLVKSDRSVTPWTYTVLTVTFDSIKAANQYAKIWGLVDFLVWRGEDVARRVNDQATQPVKVIWDGKMTVYKTKWYLVKSDRSVKPWTFTVLTVTFVTKKAANQHAKVGGLADFLAWRGEDVARRVDDQASLPVKVIWDGEI